MWNNRGTSGFGGGGAGGGDAGGFDSPGGGFSTQAQSQDSQEKKVFIRSQNVVPVTTAQVLACGENDTLKVGDTEVGTVTIVGLVRSVKEQATSVVYEIDDRTGPPLEVRLWIESVDEGAPEDRAKTVPEDSYCRVFGHMRTFQGKITVMAFKVVPVHDPNEVSLHATEVKHAKLLLQRLSEGKLDSIMTSAAAGGGGVSNNWQKNNAAAGGFAGPAAAGNSQGLSGVQEKVYDLITSSLDESGANVNWITTTIGNVTMKQIRDAIDFLSSEGHIYSTIDEDHYKSTETA